MEDGSAGGRAGKVSKLNFVYISDTGGPWAKTVCSGSSKLVVIDAEVFFQQLVMINLGEKKRKARGVRRGGAWARGGETGRRRDEYLQAVVLLLSRLSVRCLCSGVPKGKGFLICFSPKEKGLVDGGEKGRGVSSSSS